MKVRLAKLPVLLLTLIVSLAASSSARGSVSIVIQVDPTDTGFNSKTPVTPVGGNNGTTLGQQRLIAFQFAAGIWGATLNGGPPITVNAKWTGMTCTATSAVLGSASAVTIHHDFTNAPFPNTWYGAALANSISGGDRNGSQAEINTTFNVNIGTAGCLANSPWYLGLDGNHGDGVDLVAVLLHEFAHGLGFQTFTSSSTGAFNTGRPTVYDRFLRDNSTGKLWVDMTDSERAASAIRTGNLSWAGPQVTADVPSVLGTPRLRVNSPGAIAGNYVVGTAQFGPRLASSGITNNVVRSSPADGCNPIGGGVSGRIAFIDRGTCNFTIKVKNAQDAGATGVIVGNVSSSPTPDTPPEMGGADSSITIPSVSLSLTDANLIRAQLAFSISATIFLDHTVFSGADSGNRALMYAPDPVVSGSSVSHFDTSAFPNLLMEPNNSDDLTHSVMPPNDLTLSLLRDLGWTTDTVLATQNPIDGVQFFVTQQYIDFLGRLPDSTGLTNWVATLNGCPNSGFGENDNPGCDRVHVSAGFFQSDEFQGRGYWAYRFYEVGLDRRPAYAEFVPDMAQVGGPQSPQSELLSKAAYTDAYVQRIEFKNRYDALSNAAYVNALELNAEVTITNKAALIASLDGGQSTRAQVLRDIVESTAVANQFFNRAFVAMQYFGYLRRDPDTIGYNNWVTTLTNDPSNYRHMIFGFLFSTEYRQRFGP